MSDAFAHKPHSSQLRQHGWLTLLKRLSSPQRRLLLMANDSAWLGLAALAWAPAAEAGLLLGALGVGVSLACFEASGLYRLRPAQDARLLLGGAAGLLTSELAALCEGTHVPATITLSLGSLVLALPASRRCWTHLLRRSAGKKRLLLLCDAQEAQLVSTALLQQPLADLYPLGLIAPAEGPATPHALLTLGTPQQLGWVLSRYQPDVLLLGRAAAADPALAVQLPAGLPVLDMAEFSRRLGLQAPATPVFTRTSRLSSPRRS